MASAPSASSSSSTPPPTPPPFSLPITWDSGSRTRHQRRRTRSSCSSSSVSSPSSFSSFSSWSSGASYLSCPLIPPSPSPSPSPSSLSAVPFSWEDQPGVPKTKAAEDKNKAAGTTDRTAIEICSELAGGKKASPTTTHDKNISSRSSKLELFSLSSQSHQSLRPPPLRSYSDRFGFSSSFHWRRRLGLPEPGYVRDPFTVALIQCSKNGASEETDNDDDDGDSISASSKLLPMSAPERLSLSSSSLSSNKQQRRRLQTAKKEPHGGGTVITGNKFYASCKTSCAVVESAAIFIPRATRPGGGVKAYGLLRRKTM